MKRLEWISMAGVDYVLTIADGSDTTTSLTPGAQPLVTQVKDDEDLFAPVRPQTGNISIVGEVNVAEALLASNPEARAVTVTATANNTTTTVWKGYLQTAAFSQAWNRGPNEIDLPVVSHLGILDGFRLQRTDYMSFAQFVVALNNVTGTAAYDSFLFPYTGDPTTTLAYYFSTANFGQWNEDTQSYDYATFYEVLEEMCKLFGWVATEYGTTLCFVAPDAFTGYYRFTAANMEDMADGYAPVYDVVSASTAIATIYGADHDISYIPGKSMIKVTGDPNIMDKTIWRMDTGTMTQAAADSDTKSIDSGQTRYLHFFSRIYQSNSEVDVLNNMTNPRFENFEGGSDSISTGSCVSSDREYVTKSSGKNILERDSGWMSHILFKAASGWGGRVIATITPRQLHYHTGLMSGRYFLVQFGVRRSSSYTNEWEQFDGNLYLTFKIGDNSLYDGYAQVLNGKLCAASAVGLVNSPDGLGIMMQAYSGQITMEIKVPSVGDQWESGDYDYYYSIENPTISYIDPWTHYLWEAKATNIETRSIGNGYTESLEVNNKFTTYRSQQFGYGVVLDDNLGIVSTLYDSKTPEAALADRLQAYYGVSRKKLKVQVAANAAQANPANLMLPGSGTGMACLAQTVYWRDDLIEATLFEV